MIKVVEVTPISKGILREKLSYFGKDNYKLGQIVRVEIRKKEVLGIIVGIKNISEVKTEIRKASFALKKIHKIEKNILYRPNFLEAINKASDYFCTNTGQILKSLTPMAILKNLNELPKTLDFKKNNNFFKSEPQIIQEADEDRWAIYKSLIRESLAKKESVFLALPQTIDIEPYQKLLAKGIDNYTFSLHHQLSEKEIISIWKKAVSAEHPILIIARPSFLSIPRKDLKTIIIEQENSESYREINRPFIDYRKIAEFISEKEKIKLIFGDIALSTETIYRLGKKEFQPLSPPKYRLNNQIKQKLIDLTITENKKSPLSDEVQEIIKKLSPEKKHLFILKNQRGLLTNIYCRDCGAIVRCSNCSTALTVHRSTKEGRRMLCHHCGKIYEINDNCPECSSWRLESLGLGIEQLANLVEEINPKVNILKISSDHAKTKNQAEKIINKFYQDKPAILIGTEMALNYLKKEIDYVIIASVDNLLAIPNFRNSEKVLNLLIKAKKLTKKKLIIQTRNKNERAFEAILQNNLLNFYREEIAIRKSLNYPPFKILIKIILTGTKEVKERMEELKNNLEKWSPSLYPAFNFKIKNKTYWNILLKLPPNSWPDEKLLEILKNLSPEYVVKVEPENIL